MRLEFLALAVLMAPLPAQDADKPAGPEVGKAVPTARLNDHTGKAVQLGGESGTGSWTVLAFYPRAGTPG